MSAILSLLSGWQGYAAAAVIAALVASGATYYVTSEPYRLTIAQMQRDKADDGLAAADMALKDFESDAVTINAAAASFGGIRDDLSAKLSTISKEFHAATVAKPLPLDCKPDAVRLRSLSNAIAATNTAAGLSPGPTVPGRP